MRIELAFRHQLPNCYAIAMAYLADQRLIVIAGQPLAANKGPACIAAIGLVSPHELKGPWIRPTTTSMSSIVVLPGQQQFAVGECPPRPPSLQSFLQMHTNTWYPQCASCTQDGHTPVVPTMAKLYSGCIYTNCDHTGPSCSRCFANSLLLH